MTTSLRVALIALAACNSNSHPGTDGNHPPGDACASGVCVQTGSRTQWAEADSPAGEATIEHVRFDAAGHGWLAASDGNTGAYFTSDNGATWENRKPAFTAFDVAMRGNSAWLVGSDPRPVWSSTDGGAHFAPVTGVSDFLGVAAFWDETHGLIGSETGDRVWITLDGGATWQQHAFGRDVLPGIDDLAVHGIDAWAVGGPSFTPDGTGATIAHSTDQGATWTITQLADKAHDFKGGSLKGIYIASASELWVAGMNRQLFHSVDGGATWMQVSNIPAAIGDFGGLAGNGAHLVAAATTLDENRRSNGIGTYESFDSGATWQLTMIDFCALCDVRGVALGGAAAYVYGYNGTFVRGQ